MSGCCPHCGGDLSKPTGIFDEEKHAIRVSGQVRRLGFVCWPLLSLLRRHEGQWVSTARMAETVYGNSPHADAGMKTVHSHIWYLRRQLEGSGYQIVSYLGAGSPGYRLERAPQ